MERLFNIINIKPNNISLYEQAFTHTSYAYEQGLQYSYETLEFLGDAIVEAIISDYLYNSNNYKEGEMTKIRASYVCENALYEYANQLNLSKYVKVGKGEEKTGGKHKKAILADIFEALMAAIYLDLGYEKVKEVALEIIVPYIENKNILLFSDYKSVLQEAVQTTAKSLHYETIAISGPSHERTFTAAVIIDNIVYGEGIGSSKKEAEQEAAKKALEKLVKSN